MGGGSPESAKEALARLKAFAPLLAEVNTHDPAAHISRSAPGLRSTFRPRHWFAQVSPAYPWATPAVRYGSWNPARWYEHPLIGDITLRVAYESAGFLLSGDALNPYPVGRPTFGFVENSVLDRYQEHLKGIRFSVDGLWDTRRECADYDSKFLTRPDPSAEVIPEGRAVLFDTDWSKVEPLRPDIEQPSSRDEA